MQKDIRDTDLYREVASLYTELRQPGTGQISDAAEIHVSPDGRCAVFTGTLMTALEGAPTTRICQIDLLSAATRVLSFGPNLDRSPKFSPDGRQIAFLSDRHQAGDFQLYLLDPVSGAAQATPRVAGWVEYLQWSPDGTRILLGVAGHGADVSGGQGAVMSRLDAQELPSWMPTVETGDAPHRWRRAWLYELATAKVNKVGPAEENLWEAAWAGNEVLVALVSAGPSEGLWYRARCQLIDLSTGQARHLYTPRDQLGHLAGSPSGRHVAIVEAVCSDRGLVAGELRLIETSSGEVRRMDTRGVEVSSIEWLSNRRLLLAGHRGLETVVSLLEIADETFIELWRNREISTGGFFASVSGCNESGDCALIGESFVRAPEIATIRAGEYQVVKSFDLGYAGHAKAIAAVEAWSGQASDGQQIQGWLLRPKSSAPHPLIMDIHGGPVWHWRPRWLGRSAVDILMWIKQGYAVFLPNPRGSAGRGQDFARQVVGDMGGADAEDCLSALDALVAQGVADPRRLGVTGVSYGGFMTCWLITQDARFAAAVPVAPMTHHVTQQLLSNIPHFTPLFLADRYTDPNGKYFSRSPLMHAHKAKTPTLNICGALDRCTPPQEAMQFHSALLENGVESVLLVYPEEGHGIRKLPAAIDYTARTIAWFQEHMPASGSSSR